VTTAGKKVFVVMRRLESGGLTYYLEVFDTEVYTDSTVVLEDTDQTVWGSSGELDRMKGQTVWVKLDGEVLGEETLPGTPNPTITTARAGDKLEVGYAVDLEVETVSPAMDVGTGMNTLRTRRIRQAILDLGPSRGFTVDGHRVEAKQFATYVEDVEGAQMVEGQIPVLMLGYSTRPTVLIEQREPYPFYLKGIEAELVYSGMENR
jgi:hypothetical protein